MRFSPVSFVLGIAVASLVPALSRVFRPLAVEATAAGMGLADDARRVIAERMETFEDIVAEARARREHLDAETMIAELEHLAEESEEAEPAAAGRARRRANGNARRRSS
jgi:hypothetical protein